MQPLVNHVVVSSLPLPLLTASMYEYLWGANGVFIRAFRQGFSVIAPIAQFSVTGLASVQPQFCWDYPLVPSSLLREMLLKSRSVAPLEILFHLCYCESGWQLDIPQQQAFSHQVTRTASSLNSSYADAVIEVHSHHSMRATFSATDDADETGLRIFAVLGTIFSRPTLNVRVGIYQHFWHIPTHWIFEPIPEVTDAYGEFSLL